MGPTVTRERDLSKGFGKRFVVNKISPMVTKLLDSGLHSEKGYRFKGSKVEIFLACC